MSISIHFNSFNSNFNVYKDDGTTKTNSTSGGAGLVHHIERDEADAIAAKAATRSKLATDLTRYNEQLIDRKEAYENLEKAHKLIDERYAFLASKQPSDEDYAQRLKDAQKKKDALRKKLTRYKKKGYKQDVVDKVSDDLRQAKETLKTLKSSGKPDKSPYDKWSNRIGVGYTGTLQLSFDSLAKNGWQFTDSNGNLLDAKNVTDESKPFNYKEQAAFEKDNPNCDGINNVKKAYLYAYHGGVQCHQERYGAPIAASIHFDEGSPHVDYMALAIGQDLNGRWFDHVGDADNGTNGIRENTRARTFINGSNGAQNKAWTSKIQDRFANDIRESALYNFGDFKGDTFINNKNRGFDEQWADSYMSQLGLDRGIKVDDRVRAKRDRLKDAKHKADAAAKMENEADMYVSKHTKKADDILNNAASDSNKASSAASTAIASSLAQSTTQSLAISNAVRMVKESAEKSMSIKASNVYSQAQDSGKLDGYADGYNDGYNSGSAAFSGSKSTFMDSIEFAKSSVAYRVKQNHKRDPAIKGLLRAISPDKGGNWDSVLETNRMLDEHHNLIPIEDYAENRLYTLTLDAARGGKLAQSTADNIQSSASNRRRRNSTAETGGPDF